MSSAIARYYGGYSASPVGAEPSFFDYDFKDASGKSVGSGSANSLRELDVALKSAIKAGAVSGKATGDDGVLVRELQGTVVLVNQEFPISLAGKLAANKGLIAAGLGAVAVIALLALK